MNRRIVLSFAVGALLMTSAMPVFAAPKQMSDGTVFDAEYYAANNPDVAAALGTDEVALYSHYVNNGKNEGRKPCEDGATPAAALTDNFDAAYYRDNNPDVVAVVGTSEEALYNHYINHGKNEGRKPCADSVPPAANETPATSPTANVTPATVPTASGSSVTLPAGTIQNAPKNLSPFPYELYTMYFDNQGLPYMYGRDMVSHFTQMDGEEIAFCQGKIEDYCKTMEDRYEKISWASDYYLIMSSNVGESQGTNIDLFYVRGFRGYDMGELPTRGILYTWP